MARYQSPIQLYDSDQKKWITESAEIDFTRDNTLKEIFKGSQSSSASGLNRRVSTVVPSDTSGQTHLKVPALSYKQGNTEKSIYRYGLVTFIRPSGYPLKVYADTSTDNLLLNLTTATKGTIMFDKDINQIQSFYIRYNFDTESHPSITIDLRNNKDYTIQFRNTAEYPVYTKQTMETIETEIARGMTKTLRLVKPGGYTQWRVDLGNDDSPKLNVGKAVGEILGATSSGNELLVDVKNTSTVSWDTSWYTVVGTYYRYDVLQTSPGY